MQSGRSRGFGFVYYETVEDAREVSGCDFNLSILIIKHAYSPEESSFSIYFVLHLFEGCVQTSGLGCS